MFDASFFCIIIPRLMDEQLASHVIGSHRHAECLLDKINSVSLQNQMRLEKSVLQTSVAGQSLAQDFLRKYLTHARGSCEPRLHSIDQDKISHLYADLRRESATCGGVPIAVRHLESLMRMAAAHVRVWGL